MLDFVFDDHLQEVRNSVRQWPLSSDECRGLNERLQVPDPACVDVGAFLDGSLQFHSVVVVWDDVLVPK